MKHKGCINLLLDDRRLAWEGALTGSARLAGTHRTPPALTGHRRQKPPRRCTSIAGLENRSQAGILPWGTSTCNCVASRSPLCLNWPPWRPPPLSTSLPIRTSSPCRLAALTHPSCRRG